MLWPKFGLPNLYCAFVERLCLGEVAALPISLGKIVKADRGIWMVGSERFFPNLQGALVKGQSFGLFTHRAEQEREIVQAIRGFRMFRAIILLAILQHLLGDWHCFLKFARASQLLDLMSLFTNVFAILRSGCTKTQRSRAETGDATQPAISQALGPRKLVSQFFHDPRVEITTFDCKQTLVGNVAARYRISAAELHCAAFSDRKSTRLNS